MTQNLFQTNSLTVKPLFTRFFVPPITWKGDPVGHFGNHDVFFWLKKGEVILFVDKECYHLTAGQLAFLPKGKIRKYTNVTKEFSLYEMAFVAESSGFNLMEGLGLYEAPYTVTIENAEEINRLFERSSHIAQNMDPIHRVVWSANLLNIIQIFYSNRLMKNTLKDTRFLPVVDYMQLHMDQPLTIEDLAALVHMKPTYFIRRFKQTYGVSPMSYLKNFRVHKAMELLVCAEANIDDISRMVGIEDPAYFSRWFKKSCGLSPSEYRSYFKRITP